MANAFKLVTLSGVDDSAATVYTCPSATETTIIGLNLANTKGTSITASVQVENNDGDNNDEEFVVFHARSSKN